MSYKKNCLMCGNEPYSDDCPVLIIWDYDLGWIIEAVEDGEYEVHNLNTFGEKNMEIDWGLAHQIVKEKGVRIHYFHKWKTAA